VSHEQPERAEPFPFAEALTRVAFYACLVLVLVRLTISEQLRDAFDMGVTAPPAPGATTTLLLNLACLVPTLLVLLRRAIDRGYTLRMRPSHLLLFLLAAWVAASTLWASDRFASVVSASTWCAASAIAWAMSQLCRTWLRFRFVAATVLGVLLLLIAQVGIYYFYEAPELVREWDATLKQQLLRAQNLTAESPTAVQLDRNVRQAAVLGFYRSPNTVAAVALLGAIVCAAVALQRARGDKEPALAVLPAVAALLAVPPLLVTGSRTAQGLAAVALVVAAAAYLSRRTLVRRRRLVYVALLTAALVAAMAVVITGLGTGGLLHESLTFRWRYWVGSFALVRSHPWLGVGWDNFGAAYLQYRLPGAVEEIKDPHNLFVKFAAETGAIGVALAIGWLATAAWELARRTPPVTRSRAGEALRPVAAVVTAFFVLHVATRSVALLNWLELLKLALFAALLGGALLLGGVRSIDAFTLDGRRGRWLVCGVTLALGIFLAHSLVDFAMSETGPLLLFMALIGSSIGLRTFPRNARRNTPVALALLAVVGAGILAFALLVVLPVTIAESHAHAARTLTAENRTDRAAAEWRAAIAASPVSNADYTMQAADNYRRSSSPRPRETLAFLSQAVEADPRLVRGWLERARAQQSYGPLTGEADVNAIESDYRTALRLDPNSIDGRLELARFLDRVGRRDRALEQYRLVFEYSDRLPAEEIRRLPAATADEVRRRIAALESVGR
jgi:O-antigen ligase/tetratricopeptide (TPR) repeat protein